MGVESSYEDVLFAIGKSWKPREMEKWFRRALYLGV